MADMQGGEFINSGTYGCVFAPQLPCKRDSKVTEAMRAKRNKMVGKVFEHAEDAVTETAHNAAVKKVDPNNVFTVKHVKSCRIDVSKVKPADKIHRCGFLAVPYQDNYKQIVYENGGTDLDGFIGKYDWYTSTKGLYFDDLIDLFPLAFHGISRLQEMRYSHSDIKPGNLLVNIGTKRIVIVDFGLMTSYSRFWTNMYRHFDFKYMYYPPELRMFKKVYDNGRYATYDDVLTSIKENYSRWAEAWDVLNGHFNVEDDLRSLFTRYTSYSSPDKLKKRELPMLMQKLDTFSLGITILEIYFYTKHKLRNPELCKRFIETVIVPMVRFDPVSRCTAKQAYIACVEFQLGTNLGDAITKCKLTKGKGGYKIAEIRRIAQNIGLGDVKDREQICNKLRDMQN